MELWGINIIQNRSPWFQWISAYLYVWTFWSILCTAWGVYKYQTMEWNFTFLANWGAYHALKSLIFQQMFLTYKKNNSVIKSDPLWYSEQQLYLGLNMPNVMPQNVLLLLVSHLIFVTCIYFLTELLIVISAGVLDLKERRKHCQQE